MDRGSESFHDFGQKCTYGNTFLARPLTLTSTGLTSELQNVTGHGHIALFTAS